MSKNAINYIVILLVTSVTRAKGKLQWPQSSDVISGPASVNDNEAYTAYGNSSTTPVVPSLTPKQYTQLLQVLHKHNADQEKANNDDIMAVGFLAGKSLCFFTAIGSNT